MVATIERDVTMALEVMDLLKKKGLKPSDSMMVIGALHAFFIAGARREGKPTTIEAFVDLYRMSLELYFPILEECFEHLKEGGLDPFTPKGDRL